MTFWTGLLCGIFGAAPAGFLLAALFSPGRREIEERLAASLHELLVADDAELIEARRTANDVLQFYAGGA